MLVGQVQRKPLERFRAAIGVGKIYGPYGKNWRRKPIYQWTVYKKADVYRALMNLWPYLSTPKRKQALTMGFKPNNPPALRLRRSK